MSTPTTGPSVHDVDAAVRSVLAEILHAARANGSSRRGSGSSRGDEVFAGRLLSLRQAEALPAGLSAVRVAPGTVVTPMARDYLRRLGVAIRFVARAEAERAGIVAEWGFVIETGSGVIEAFRRSLLDGTDEWHDLGTSVPDGATWAADANGRGALVLTEEASVAVYRACQLAGVRAAAADDAAAAARAVKALGVNVLVVEPAGKPIGLLKQIGLAFRRGGAPVAPDWLEPTHGGRGS